MRHLDIVTCVSNPIGWESRIRLARDAILSWLKEPEIRVTLVECAYGARAHELSDLASVRVTHVPVRATTLVWNKECLMNIGLHHLAHDAKYIGTFDADVMFRQPGWADAAVRALDLYPAIQPWDTAYDLGPNDEHLATHKSFAAAFHAEQPVFPTGGKFWQADGGPYVYPHPGYAWAWQRGILDRIGGLFELGGMGAGDHHMALACVGHAEKSIPHDINGAYREAVLRWGRRAAPQINGKLGFIRATIEHPFHGRKADRKYWRRWDMFVEHDFDPHEDMKRNSFGVLEFSGEKPALERAFDRYLRARGEDANGL